MLAHKEFNEYDTIIYEAFLNVLHDGIDIESYKDHIVVNGKKKIYNTYIANTLKDYGKEETVRILSDKIKSLV